MTSKYDDMGRDELLAEAKERELEVHHKTGEEKLRAMLMEDDAASSVVEIEEPSKEFGGLTVDDLVRELEEGPGGDYERRSPFDPFAGYPTRYIEVRYRPRWKRLDKLPKDGLLQYCLGQNIMAKEWVVTPVDIPSTQKDQRPRFIIETDWDKDKILAWIDKKELHTIPAHWLVFSRVEAKRIDTPHTRPMKSWITNVHTSISFHLSWPLADRANPYREGKPNQCTIVADDTLRARLMFVRQLVTGATRIRRLYEGGPYMYYLLDREMNYSLPILRNIYTAGTKGSKALQQWEREEGGLPSAL